MISVEPMMSLSTFLIGSMFFFIIGMAIVEYIDYRRNKSASKTGQRQASASQKAIQRYYRRKGA